MKTATTEFLNLQSKHNLQYYKEINLYRRYWDPGTTSYKWDPTPVELKPYLQSISNLNWQLDTEGLNIWRISNLTLTLKNTNNEFTPSHVGGHFETKELHKSKLEIKIGYKNSLGTTYTLEIFNGIILNDPSFDCLSKLVTLYISGLEILTQEGDAEKVSINVTDEVIGTGTGEDSQTFYTANNGVGKIVDVKAGGTLQLQGVDYNVSNLNSPSGSAHINFIPAPPSPLSVTSSYIYWKSNVSIKSLVEDLLQEAGFKVGEYSVEEGLFYYGDKTEVWNKKPELEDSIRSRNIDTVSSPGYILQKKEDFISDVNLDGLSLDGENHIYLPYFNSKYECNDLPENAVPQWTTWGGYHSTFNREITSSQYHNWGRVIGSDPNWQKERTDYRDTDKTTSLLIRCKMDVTIVLDGMSNPDCAYLKVDIKNGSYATWFRIKQYRHTYLNWKQVELGGAAPITFDTAVYHNYWIVMNGSAVDLYIDNVKMLSATATPTTDNYVGIYQYAGEYNSGHEWDFESFIDYVYWTPESIRPAGPYFPNKYECDDLPENATPPWNTESGAYGFARSITSSQYYSYGVVSRGLEVTHERMQTDYRNTDQTISLLIRCRLMVNFSGYGETFPSLAYLKVTISNGSYTTWFKLKRSRHATGDTYELELDGATPITFSGYSYHTYWLVMDGSTVDLYVDNVLTLSSTASASTENCVRIEQYAYEWELERTLYYESYIDYVHWTSEMIRPADIANIEGVSLSTALDFGKASQYYGKIFRSHYIPSGCYIVYETQLSGTSDFSSDNDSWRIVSWAGDVGSINTGMVKKRYLRWRVTMIVPWTGADSPEITELTMPGSVLFNTTDCSTDLQEYRSYECWNTLNSQEIKLYSMSSADDITYDAETEIIGITISSAVKRYIKFRNIISKILSGNTAIIYRDKFIFRIKSINVLMANFSNQTCQKAIENLASLLDFELGITGEGIYFFRSKSIGGAVKRIFQRGKDLISVKSVKPGWDRIKNLVISQYGEYYENSDRFLADDPRPNSQDTYGKRFEKLGETGAYVDPTMNVAIGQVETYFKNHKESKKEVVIDTKVIPQLDLADKVQVDSDGLSEIDFKVVGINLDINNWGMEIILWEI